MLKQVNEEGQANCQFSAQVAPFSQPGALSLIVFPDRALLQPALDRDTVGNIINEIVEWQHSQFEILATALYIINNCVTYLSLLDLQ